MNIVIAGGRNKADFLIGSLLEKQHQITVINDEENYCQFLSEKHGIPVIMGNPCKRYVLEEAEIENADILIALRPSDPDNLAICQIAKQYFHVKKVVATVSNPKNVTIFKKLGVNTAISATYMISKVIEQASTIEHLVNTLSIEQGNITLNELQLTKDCKVLNKCLKNITLPNDVIICCILRQNHMVVPNGNTKLFEHDKLFILAFPEAADRIDAIFYNR